MAKDYSYLTKMHNTGEPTRPGYYWVQLSDIIAPQIGLVSEGKHGVLTVRMFGGMTDMVIGGSGKDWSQVRWQPVRDETYDS